MRTAVQLLVQLYAVVPCVPVLDLVGVNPLCPVVQLYLQLYMIKNHDTPISSRFFNCDASLDMIDVGNCYY